MALFTIAFGTRHLDVGERHEGMVAAIAFESIVKLVAFLGVGSYVTFGSSTASATSSARRAAPDLARLMAPLAEPGARQLGVDDGAVDARDRLPAAPVPGGGDRERRREAPEDGGVALPAYMLAINVFVPPSRSAGLMLLPSRATWTSTASC
jgi:hypothetical protein